MKLNLYQILAIMFFIIGMIMIYLIAEIEDAPGLIILGFSILGTLNSILYGIGDIIKKDNK